MNNRLRTIVLCTILFSGYANAHDHMRPELNDWFGKLESKKGPCCSDADGTAISDSDWESVNDPGKPDIHYRVRIDNEWVDVPDEAVLNQPNKYGRTMVWPIRGYLGISIRCFIVGAQG